MATERRTILLGLLALGVLVVCCGPDRRDVEPRNLDYACKTFGCSAEGSAVETTGLTNDTLGFVLGPKPGRVIIPSEGGTVEVLIAGHGQVRLWYGSGEETPPTPIEPVDVPSDYAWVSVTQGDSFSGWFVVEAVEGSTVELVDYCTSESRGCGTSSERL